MTEIETHASKELPACTRRGMRSGKRDALGAWWRGWEAKIGVSGEERCVTTLKTAV